MLPVTQTSLVSLTHPTRASRGISRELAQYVRWEYGANEFFAHAMIAEAKRARKAQARSRSDGWVRRLLASVRESLVPVRASPGGA